MLMNHYLYNVKYDRFEAGLCMLEMRALFEEASSDKVIFSDIKINPSISPYIKNRIGIICKKESLDGVIEHVKNAEIHAEAFLVKYIQLLSDNPRMVERKLICKQIGTHIIGLPSFEAPERLFAITQYGGFWYFGELLENDPRWRSHDLKPHSYSSSLGINVAKALVNIASKGHMTAKLIDPCCGVGTVLLEGHFSGYDIIGWEINCKIAENARLNLIHYNYPGQVVYGDIKDVEGYYDGSIVDLPYGNFSMTSLDNVVSIIKHAKRISKRIVLVSSMDIQTYIDQEGLQVIDYCEINKRRNEHFTRRVWVCD